MRFLRFLGRHPLTLLGIIALAFVGWVWRDTFAPRAPSTVESKGLHDANGPLRKFLPPPDGLMDASARPQDATYGLAKLKPGMPRAEVEKLVGAPAADHVSPATISDGRVTYHASYEADLGPLQTVRPIRSPRALPQVRPPDESGRTLVTLEFDATKPGHPLVGIHYPDPLF